jgi:phosphoribosyl 1,2-cyclic phosphodiesterase
MNIKVTCFGATGGIAAPSRPNFDRSRYGGNTSCYFIEAGPFNIIHDMGSGMRILGQDELMKYKMFMPDFKGRNYIIHVSHWHRDHIEGMSFCPILYMKNRINLIGMVPRSSVHGHRYVADKVRELLESHQDNPYFPLPFGEMKAVKNNIRIHASSPVEIQTFTFCLDDYGNYTAYDEMCCPDFDRIKLTTFPTNHPGDCNGLRIDYKGSSVTFTADNQPHPYPNKNVMKVGKDTDLLIADGQYTEEQLKGLQQDYGHGSVGSCIKEAIACNAKRLVISHHDPNNDDKKLDELGMVNDKECNWDMAKEGQVWEV